MHPVRRGRAAVATSDSTSATTFQVAVHGDTQADDLVVVQFGLRALSTTPTFPDGWEVRGTGIDWTSTTNSPAVFIAWGKPPDPNNPTAPITVAWTGGSQAVAQATTFDGATVFWPFPLNWRTRDRGYVSNINMQGFVSFGGNWGATRDGRVDFMAGASAFYRGNAGWNVTPDNPTNWSDDFVRGISGPTNDASSVRGVFGARTSGMNQAASSVSVQFGNIGLTANAYASMISYLVRGIHVPIAAFQGDQNTSDYGVAFDSSDTYEPVADYLWDFGDGSTSTEANPTHVYTNPGTYRVRLTVTNAAGTDWVEHDVVVSEIPPTAAFTYVNLPGSLDVVFTDASVLATAWSWDFGDGNTSTDASPVHTYAAAGTYTVRLTVTNAAGTDDAQIALTVVLGTPPPPRPDGVVVDVQVELGSTWESLYCDLTGADWAWGASEDAGYLTVGAPTQLRAVLADPERRFDPGNASSPDYGLLRTGVQVRVLLGTDVVFQGRLVDVLHDLTFAYLTVDDVISQLGVVDVDTDGPLSLPDAQAASTRIAALANLAGWPTALTDVENDPTELLGSELAERTVWEALVETAQATLGVLATSQQGELVYRTRASAWAPGDPVFVVGCDLGDGTPADVGTDSIAMASGAARIRNLVSAHRKGTDDPPVVAQDQASIDAYGLRTATADLVVRNQGDLTTWVDLVLGNLKQPAYGGRAVQFVLRTPALAAKVATARFGDLWHLYDTHHGAPIDVVGRLAGLAYQVGPSTVTVTATIYEDPGLAPAQRQAVLDTSAELAQGTLENLTASTGVAVLDKTTPA